MTRSLGNKRVSVALLALTLVAASGITAVRNASSGLPTTSFDHVSTAGAPTMLPPTNRLLMRAIRNGEATGEQRLLGAREGHAFYRIRTGRGLGRYCYGVGPWGSAEGGLDVLQCHREFPSRDYPVLPFITVAAAGASREPKVIHAEGIAADGVMAVGFQTPDGRYVGRTTVQNNLYRIMNIPTEDLAAFVAFSASGDVVYILRLPLPVS